MKYFSSGFRWMKEFDLPTKLDRKLPAKFSVSGHRFSLRILRTLRGTPLRYVPHNHQQNKG